MKYQAIGEIVDAYNSDDLPIVPVEAWPEWLQDAWNRPKETEGSMWKQGDEYRIFEGGGIYIVSEHDYIVRPADLQLYLCDRDNFLDNYEPIDQ